MIDAIVELAACLVLVGFFWGGCACCGVVCEFFTDDFADGSLTDWTQTSGAWTESSGVVTTTSSNAILTCDTTQPDAESAMQVSALVQASDSGDEIRIIVGSDGTDYHYVQLKVGASGHLRIYRYASSSATQLAEVTGTILSNGVADTMNVCVDVENEKIRVTVGGAYLDADVSTFYGDEFALATGSLTGTAQFDNAVASRVSDDCPCDGGGETTGCESFCTDSIVPELFRVTLTGTANGQSPDPYTCSSANPADGTYYCDWVTEFGGLCTWGITFSPPLELGCACTLPSEDEDTLQIQSVQVFIQEDSPGIAEIKVRVTFKKDLAGTWAVDWSTTLSYPFDCCSVDIEFTSSDLEATTNTVSDCAVNAPAVGHDDNDWVIDVTNATVRLESLCGF